MTDKIKNFNRSFPRDFAFVQRTVANRFTLNPFRSKKYLRMIGDIFVNAVELSQAGL
jgi:hypothetical protein